MPESNKFILFSIFNGIAVIACAVFLITALNNTSAADTNAGSALPVSKGGTGANTAPDAIANLGAVTTLDNSDLHFPTTSAIKPRIDALESDAANICQIQPDYSIQMTAPYSFTTNDTVVAGATWTASATGFVSASYYRSAYTQSYTGHLLINGGYAWSTVVGGSSNWVFIKQGETARIYTDGGSDWVRSYLRFIPYRIVCIPK